MKHMILSFNMKGDLISDQFLMLWFQKDSLDTVGFKTFRGGPGVLNKVMDFGGPKWHLDSKALLGLSLNFTKILRKAHMSQYMW